MSRNLVLLTRANLSCLPFLPISRFPTLPLSRLPVFSFSLSSTLRLEVELQLAFAAGAEVAHLHALKLVAAIHLAKGAELEVLHRLAGGVVGLGQQDAVLLDVDPGEDAGVAAGRRCGRDAFEDPARAAAAHFVLEDALLRPMEKFEAEIAEPEVGAGELTSQFFAAYLAGGHCRGRKAGSTAESVTVGGVRAVRDGEFLRLVVRRVGRPV